MVRDTGYAQRAVVVVVVGGESSKKKEEGRGRVRSRY